MPKDKDGKIVFTVEDLTPIVRGGGIVDATKGGLLLGNSHTEDGIKMIRENSDGEYEVIGEVEGWEYMLSPFATEKYRSELVAINDEMKGCKDTFLEYEIDESVSILDLTPIFPNIPMTGKLLLLGKYSQFVINKYSTKKYLLELDQMNKNA